MADFAKSIFIDFWATIAEMSPYLLFGFFVAGILSAFVSQRFVETHLGGRGIWPIVKASLFGVPLPLCSCSVIPVSMSLHRHGASRGSTIAFLLSTPQTGIDSIFVTLSLLGPFFAVFRPIVAFATGIVGGILVDVFDKTAEDKNGSQKCTDQCCTAEKNNGKIIRGLKYGFVTLPRDIGKPMLAGLVVAAFISALVPDDFFAEKLGTGIFPMLVMMLLGIPIYVCATASVPIAAALILKGLTPGAALVFLITGPATNAASLIIIWKALGSKTAVIYLVSVVVCALASGILLDYIAPTLSIQVATHSHRMLLPTAVKYASVFVLLTVLSFAIFKKPAHPDTN